MSVTSIEWFDRTINPIRARVGTATGHYCEKVSAGCAHCYASRLQSRFRMPAFDQARDRVEVFFDAARLEEVLRRRTPTRWFWGDMTDLFGPWVENGWLDQIFATMALTPQHTHLVLTKRPERMRSYLSQFSPAAAGKRESFTALSRLWSVGFTLRRSMWPLHMPLPNVHLGVSVEDQATADARIPLLLQTPAAVRWVSVEPALGPIDFIHRRGHDHYQDSLRGFTDNGNWSGSRSIASKLDWVVCGGESGPKARPCDVAWLRAVVRQCREASVPVFVKQLGARPVGFPYNTSTWVAQPTEALPLSFITNRKGADMSEWPADLRVREFPAVAR